MKCPRCGSQMSGGICDSCGFPLTNIRIQPKYRNDRLNKIKEYSDGGSANKTSR